jgi:hypothetical protein
VDSVRVQRRSRHRRLAAAAACRVYGLTIWLYPPDFRRAFGRELAITFRNRVEDVLDAGGLRHWLAFIVHIALDTLSTYRMLLTPGDQVVSAGAGSLLGLGEGDVAHGGLDHAMLEEIFASAGVLLAFAGWLTFLVILPKYGC